MVAHLYRSLGLGLGLSVEQKESSLLGLERSISAYVQQSLGKSTKVMFMLAKGQTKNSPEWLSGLQISRRF
jgi:hypothetical protein